MTPLLLTHVLRAIVAIVRVIGCGWRWLLRRLAIEGVDGRTRQPRN
jgi:hypothetical protein